MTLNLYFLHMIFIAFTSFFQQKIHIILKLKYNDQKKIHETMYYLVALGSPFSTSVSLPDATSSTKLNQK